MDKNNTKELIFIHDPCPDGACAGAILYGEKGTDAHYAGLGYGRPEDIAQKIREAVEEAKSEGRPLKVTFADTAPKLNVLKELLADSGIGQVVILDHHGTHVDMIKGTDTQTGIEGFFQQNPQYRSKLDMDGLREGSSGAGLVWDYVHPQREKPDTLNLIEAMDLSPSQPEVIEQFPITPNMLSEKQQAVLNRMMDVSGSDEINASIVFYGLAAAMDEELKRLETIPDMHERLAQTQAFFTELEEKGVGYLLEKDIQLASGAVTNAEEIFSNQMEYQKSRLSEEQARVMPSPHDGSYDMLLVHANMRSGRTFNALISDRLQAVAEQTGNNRVFAMVSGYPPDPDVFQEKIPENTSIYTSLRRISGDETVNLKDIAAGFKESGAARQDAGGHPGAAAVQMDKDQMLVMLMKDTVLAALDEVRRQQRDDISIVPAPETFRILEERPLQENEKPSGRVAEVLSVGKTIGREIQLH